MNKLIVPYFGQKHKAFLQIAPLKFPHGQIPADRGYLHRMPSVPIPALRILSLAVKGQRILKESLALATGGAELELKIRRLRERQPH